MVTLSSSLLDLQHVVDPGLADAIASGTSPSVVLGDVAGLLPPELQAFVAPSLLEAVAAGTPAIDVLADFAASLPPSLQAPDATPSIPTGLSEVSRSDALGYAELAAVPRLVDGLGAAATGVVAGGGAYAITVNYDDPITGFHGVQLQSLLDGTTVFAVDGTDFNSPADVVADLDLGRPQAASPLFAAMVSDAGIAASAGREVVFSGASLGGALVQVAGYETAHALLAADPGYAGRIGVFGIDALGGRDATESLNGGSLDPAVLDRLNAINIHTASDIVSRIGSHLGDTLSFQAVDAAGNPVALTPDQSHVNLESLFATLSSDTLFVAGVRGDPGEIGGLALLANTYGPEVASAFAAGALDGVIGASAAATPVVGGTADPAGRFIDFDADMNGTADLRILLHGTPASADLLIA